MLQDLRSQPNFAEKNFCFVGEYTAVLVGEDLGTRSWMEEFFEISSKTTPRAFDEGQVALNGLHINDVFGDSVPRTDR